MPAVVTDVFVQVNADYYGAVVVVVVVVAVTCVPDLIN